MNIASTVKKVHFMRSKTDKESAEITHLVQSITVNKTQEYLVLSIFRILVNQTLIVNDEHLYCITNLHDYLLLNYRAEKKDSDLIDNLI